MTARLHDCTTARLHDSVSSYHPQKPLRAAQSRSEPPLTLYIDKSIVVCFNYYIYTINPRSRESEILTMKNTATTATTATTFDVKRIVANDRLTAEAHEIINAYNNCERPYTLQLEFFEPVDITDRRSIDLALETLECRFVSDDAELLDVLNEASEYACPCFFSVYYPDVIS